jgi:Polyketide cyclase / dehydrase and lipid transport
MQNQTVTRAAEADFGPAEIYEFLTQVGNLPQWAPVFADAIERVDDRHFRVTKSGDTFRLEVVSHVSAGAVDYIREMTDNKRGGAYIRVTPRPLGGSTITMTVPLGPNTTESEVARVVDQELAELIRLSRPRLRQVG